MLQHGQLDKTCQPNFGEEVEILSPEDILPDNFRDLAPDDKTVGMAAFFSRKVRLTGSETEIQTAILLAYEEGHLQAWQALDYLEYHDVAPYDDLLTGAISIMRARALQEAA